MRHILAGSAKSKNLDESIRSHVSLEKLRQGLKQEIFQDISNIYDGEPVYMWALSDGYKLFDELEAGDILLLREKDTDYFGYLAQIAYLVKTDGKAGESVWHEDSWTGLLFLKEIRKINLPRDEVYKGLGYENDMKNYPKTVIKEINDASPALINALAGIDTPKPAENKPSFIEGRTIKVVSKRYERDPRLRKMLLDKKGSKCVCCGFDFEKAYGEIGRGFIHIHHLRPLHAQKEESLNSVEDLEPVCPNCHAMLHRERDKILSLEALKEIIGRNQER